MNCITLIQYHKNKYMSDTILVLYLNLVIVHLALETCESQLRLLL